MKKFVITVFILLMITQINQAQWMTAETDSLIRQVNSKINLDTMKSYLRVLTGVDSVTIGGNRYLITTRNRNYPGNNFAADYIYQTLNQTGLPTFNDNYSSSGRNIYSVQTGSEFPDEEFIICAHYDDMPQSSFAPGADDNASGVAAVLEAARVISKIQTRYTIIYALWDEEEIGLVGSRNYANHALQSGENILGVVNADMIAWDSDNDNVLMLYTSSVCKSLDLARLGGAIANYFLPVLYPVIIPSSGSGSDHASFWEKGYSAFMIEEASIDYNPYYHTSNDNLNHFNFDYFFNMAKLSIGTLMFLNINGLTEGNINSSISSLDRTYAKLGEDSVQFRIAFPDFDPGQNFVAHLLCSNVYGPVIDSITLFDDGLHGDSLSGDGIFGGYIPPRTTEDYFIPAVSTFDLNTNKYHCVTQWVPFTTIGPVIVDSVYTTQGTQNNFMLTIILKNESATKTVEYAQLKLECLDPWVSNPSQIRDLGNFLPGGTQTANFNIISLDSLPHGSLNTEIEILSVGYSFWKYFKNIVTGTDGEPLEQISFNLEQNYPNPFNPETKIKYSIKEPSRVTLKIYDILGRETATLINEYKPSGTYELTWNAANLPSGVYFYKLTAGRYTAVKKMLLLK